MKLLKIFGVSLCFLQIWIECGNCDYYSSLTELNKLLQFQELLIDNYENFVKAEQVKNSLLIDYMNRIQKEMDIANRDPRAYYENPLNSYKAIKRLSRDWRDQYYKLHEKANQAEYQKTLDAMKTQRDMPLPVLDDLIGAAKGIARLQSTYNLLASHLANGTILNKKVSSEMSAADCYELGTHLLNLKDYKNAATWLLQARQKLAYEKKQFQRPGILNFPYLTADKIMNSLVTATLGSGNIKLALWLTEEQLQLNPNNVEAQQNLERLTRQISDARLGLSNMVPEKQTPQQPQKYIIDLYERTCRGDLKQTPAEQRTLHCRYVHNDKPFCLIAPFKLEILNHDPFVAVYHDVLYDNEIQQIINKSKHSFKRSGVGNVRTGQVSDVRTSKNTWLQYHQHPFLDPLYHRLHEMTGLSMMTAEPLQVATYGIGGHYGPHFDFFEVDEGQMHMFGNRILTAIFYMNDVQLGGGTAFPYLRLLVPPKKGSVLIWYNLHKSLEMDYRTKHAGCPVILGAKWICNEWFHSQHQEFLRPCDLYPEGHKSIDYKKFDNM